MNRPLFSLNDLSQEAPEEKSFLRMNGSADTAGSIDVLEQLKCHFPTDTPKGILFVNKGFWNMHELLLALIDISGPVNLTFSSYAISETAARILAKLKQEGLLLSIRCVIDNRIDTRSAGSLQLLRSIADHVTLCACHAKVTLLHHHGIHYSVTGSANYTENKRYETGYISNSFMDYIFHKKWLDAAMNEHGQYHP